MEFGERDNFPKFFIRKRGRFPEFLVKKNREEIPEFSIKIPENSGRSSDLAQKFRNFKNFRNFSPIHKLILKGASWSADQSIFIDIASAVSRVSSATTRSKCLASSWF